MFKKTKFTLFVLLPILALSACGGGHDKIGEASTKFNLFGKNDRIEIEQFSDPDFSDISCYISFAKKGGLSETVNMEEDVSNFSLSCVKNTPAAIDVTEPFRKRGEVYRRRANFTFKTMQVERYYDAERNVFVYMAYSDRILEGSPHNAVSAVPLFGVAPATANQPMKSGDTLSTYTTYEQEKAKQASLAQETKMLK